jgi:hypothetical protein
MNSASSAVERLFFQELKDGDIRKIQAASNDAPTGGGARDLRVPEAAFWEFFSRMLSGRSNRRSARRTVEVLVSTVKWPVGEAEERRDLLIWPPQDKRPGEIRIAQVNRNFPSNVPSGRPFVLLVQLANGEIWGHYTTESALRSGNWDERIRRPILGCIDAAIGHSSIRGFVDLRLGTSWCHA